MTSRKGFKFFLDMLPISIYKTNLKGEILFANEHLYKLLKINNVEKNNLNAIMFYKEKEKRNELLKNIKDRGTSTLEYKLITKKGEEIWVRDYVYRKGENLYGVLIDITKEKEFQERLLKKDKFLSIIANNIQKLLTIPYEEDILENIAKTFCETTESDRTVIIEFVSIEKDLTEIRAHYQKYEENNLKKSSYNFNKHVDLLKKKDYLIDPKELLKENTHLKSLLILPIKDKEKLWGVMLFENYNFHRKWEKEEIEILKIGVDILGVAILQRKLMDKLMLQSILDDLTGLHNRRGFFNRANNFLNHQEVHEAYLFFIDFDNLKKINDKYGHKEGDMALKTISKILKETFRKKDIVARIGGDEFVVLTDVENFKNAKELKERINKKIEEINKLKIFPYKLSVSIGIAKYDPTKIKNIDELIILSDEDMYREKRIKKRGSASPLQE